MRCTAKYYPNLALVSSHKQMAVYELHDLHPAWRDMQLSAGLPVKSKYSMHCENMFQVLGQLWSLVAQQWGCHAVAGQVLVHWSLDLS
jgi:hypothetical protein